MHQYEAFIILYYYTLLFFSNMVCTRIINQKNENEEKPKGIRQEAEKGH